MTSSSSLAFLVAGLAACATDPSTDPTQSAGTGDGKADSASIFERVELVSTSFSEESPIDSESAAATEAASFLAAVQSSDLDTCAFDLHVARAQVFGRFDNCRAFANPVTFPDGTRWAPAFECDAGFCAPQPLDGAELVRFAGSASFGTASGRPLARGDRPIVILDLRAIAGLVSTEDFTHPIAATHGVLAVVPHLFVRTDGGRFVEAPGLPALPHDAGAQIGLGFDSTAVRIAIPAHADRLEFYLRFERWNFTRVDGEDASTAARLDSRASDAYVSNFGDNFRLPVE
jgi:hypothetical protein